MPHSPLLNTDSRRIIPAVEKDRRGVRRTSIAPQQVLPVVIRCGQGTVCKGRVLNVSAQGMLVEFSKDQIPPVGVNAKVDVKLHYLGDSIWLPGLIRHRMGRKVGFHFPTLAYQPKRNVKHPLTIVLHSLTRAVVSAQKI